VSVDEHTLTLGGAPVFYRGTPVGPLTPLYLHTAPTSSDDWSSLLERTGGLAPDLIGFGRSAKGGHLDYSPAGLARFVDALLTELGIEQIALAGHGWGAAVAAALGAQSPGRVRRLVLIDPAPALGEAHWHRLARWWRRPLAGEIVMGLITRGMLARHLRGASTYPERVWPPERVDAVWEQFDQGTQRATLRLYRWADEPHRAQIATALASISVPKMVVWGALDPWFAPAAAGGGSDEVVEVEGAGHWPWLDRPEVADRIADFLTRP
jgi:pimeloyl-ACP methyl ester carboxylesterase